jgi:hypothetical protein
MGVQVVFNEVSSLLKGNTLTLFRKIEAIRRRTTAKIKTLYEHEQHITTEQINNNSQLPTGTQYSLYTIYHHHFHHRIK